MAAGHPSDADREEAARPLLNAAVAAARAGDAQALGECYADDVAWLSPDGAVRGRDAAVERHMAIAAVASSWSEPQQHGAKAALRWSGPDGPGALVVEARRGRIIFAAVA